MQNVLKFRLQNQINCVNLKLLNIGAIQFHLVANLVMTLFDKHALITSCQFVNGEDRMWLRDGSSIQ